MQATNSNAAEFISDVLENDTKLAGEEVWMLAYIDTFILIITFFVTLLTFSSNDFESTESEFKSEQQEINALQAEIEPAPEGIESNDPPSLTIETKKFTEMLEAISLGNADIEHIMDEIESNEALKKELSLQQIQDILEATDIANADKERIIEIAESQLLSNQKSEVASLREDLKALDLGDKVQLTIEKGFAQLEIQDRVLFPSGTADLTAEGNNLLAQIIPLLKSSSGLIVIEGHTDNIPISTTRYPSNWELAAGRSTSVLLALVVAGMERERLRAVSYADIRPIAENDTEEGRQKNRRVSLLLQIPEEIEPESSDPIKILDIN